MKKTGEHEMPEEIAALAEKITEWRQERKNRKAIPRELWEEAARLGREFGIYPVSRDLNLHYGRLKGLVIGKETSGRKEKPTGHPSTSIRSTRTRRPNGVNRALP